MKKADKLEKLFIKLGFMPLFNIPVGAAMLVHGVYGSNYWLQYAGYVLMITGMCTVIYLIWLSEKIFRLRKQGAIN